MTPRLIGRIETRIFLLAVLGGIIDLIITPALPLNAMGATLGAKYGGVFEILAIVAVVGIAWELLYHGLQQFRWEKDWPTMFGLLLGIPEGAVTLLIARSGIISRIQHVPVSAFVIDFAIVWVAVWIFANGPMRLFTVHWRYRGGQLV